MKARFVSAPGACPICDDLDGEEFDSGEDIFYISHPNCRCELVADDNEFLFDTPHPRRFMTSTKVERAVHLRTLGGVLRAAKFDGRDYAVVPVTLLVEGVVHSSTAAEPELVLFEELAKAPNGWNGRPTIGDHPEDPLGNKVSANSPDTLERYAHGQVFNVIAESGELRGEAWLDPQRMERCNQGHVLEQLRRGEIVEVSTGLMTSLEMRSGTWNGKRYSAIWRGIVPDHLAIGLNGKEGACSVADGCGAGASVALRAASVHYVEQETMMEPDKESTPKRTLRQRVMALMKFKTQDGEADLSDMELRQALGAALNAAEPAFEGIDSVFASDNLIVYVVVPNNEFKMMQRSYTLDGAKVTLNDDAIEVQPVTRFEPVAATLAAASTATAHACGCASKGAGDMDKAQRIKALIDTGQFKEAQRKWLEGATDEDLTVLEAATKPSTPPSSGNQPASGGQPAAQPAPAAEPAKQPAPKAEEAPVERAASAKTLEQYIESAPPELRDEFRAMHTVTLERKAAAIKALKATGRCKFSDVELDSMPMPQLARICELAQVAEPITSVVDWSGRGVPRAAAADDKTVPKAERLIDVIGKKASGQ